LHVNGQFLRSFILLDRVRFRYMQYPKNCFLGLKVVELSAVLAGPAVGMFFAELGAEVIKIENRTTGGDMTRGWKAAGEDPTRSWSAYFAAVNWGKQHLMLDLADPTDLAHALNLIRAADVVISNFKPSSAARLGLDADSLCADNQRLIFGQIYSFADPNDDAPAFDIVLQAEAGYLYMTGESPERPPVRMPVAFIDTLAAHQLKEAILIALLQRERTGQGTVVSVSLLESALSSLLNQAANYLNNGHVPQRMGTQHPNIAPYGDMFVCADGRTVVLAVGTERQYERLCRDVLDVPELTQHVDYQTNTQRVQHREALCGELAVYIRNWGAEAFLERCRSCGVPAARIRDMAEVFELPAAQAMILEEVMSDGSVSRRLKTNAFRMRE
jgi:crotonobetainyl-CoA:carnitine CoA-transferase CaiB-like acyl-CoA transferase